MLNTSHLIALLATQGIGRKTVHHTIGVLERNNIVPSTTQELIDALVETKRLYPRTHLPSKHELLIALHSAESILADVDRLDLHVLNSTTADFPQQLRMIADPAVVLYVKGNVSSLMTTKAVAVIGTREPTVYGQRMAKRCGFVFSEHGLTVVSGLAAGCDTAAHEGCLAANGQTIAVLAHGLDRVYPVENRDLAERIVDGGGCLISEYSPGEPPRRSYFVERDRLQSGMSAAVVVIETDLDGGSMHTVKFCIEQGKVLACLTHPPEFESHQRSNGNRKLLHDGKAMPIGSSEDLQAFINAVESHLNPEVTLQHPCDVNGLGQQAELPLGI